VSECDRSSSWQSRRRPSRCSPRGTSRTCCRCFLHTRGRAAAGQGRARSSRLLTLCAVCLQLRAWRSARGALPHALRARILDVLSYAFDLELRGGCGRVRANELAFWMEALSQLVETAPWNLTSAGALPLAFRAEQHSPLNVRVLRNLSPAALVSLSVEGAAVCDELLSAVAALPALTSATLVCPRRTKPCVSDAGVSALADSRSLRVLSLTGSAVTDDGVSALRRLTTLVCLDLSGSSQLSAASIQSLGRSSAGRDMPPQAREAAGGQPQLACVLMLDMERAGSSAVAGSGEQGTACLRRCLPQARLLCTTLACVALQFTT
jgi:hypothetical protein